MKRIVISYDIDGKADLKIFKHLKTFLSVLE